MIWMEPRFVMRLCGLFLLSYPGYDRFGVDLTVFNGVQVLLSYDVSFTESVVGFDSVAASARQNAQGAMNQCIVER